MMKRPNAGAMVHIMLPDSAGRTDRPGKYADTAVALLVKELDLLGCKNRSLVAKMAGGACMFEYFGANLNIGERNAERVRVLLKDNHIPRHSGRCRRKSRSLGYVHPTKSRKIYYQESRWYEP